MTTTKHETEIILDPDVPLVRIIREFDAPPDKVFRAHVDPDLVAQWLGPARYRMEIDHWDCRTGGSWRFLHVDDDNEHGFHGSFHQVRSPDRIVQTFTYEGFPDGVSLETLTLEALDGDRTRLVATSLVDSFEGRDAFIASGMESGMRESHERLDALLATV